MGEQVSAVGFIGDGCIRDGFAGVIRVELGGENVSRDGVSTEGVSTEGVSAAGIPSLPEVASGQSLLSWLWLSDLLCLVDLGSEWLPVSTEGE